MESLYTKYRPQTFDDVINELRFGDGEAPFHRYNFFGIADEEKLPDWAEGAWSRAPIDRCRAVLEMILQAQRMRQSNVGAPAVMDLLVQQIMEETETW